MVTLTGIANKIVTRTAITDEQLSRIKQQQYELGRRSGLEDAAKVCEEMAPKRKLFETDKQLIKAAAAIRARGPNVTPG